MLRELKLPRKGSGMLNLNRIPTIRLNKLIILSHKMIESLKLKEFKGEIT
jgi:hypothetical protein